MDFETSHDNTVPSNGGWKTVTYKKTNPKKATKVNQKAAFNTNGSEKAVFKSIEKHAEERRKKIEAAKLADLDFDNSATRVLGSDDDEESGGENENKENAGVVEKKKVKAKKEKKVKVTVPEAAAKIVADHLASFLAEITVSFESQHGIQLMRFADYFGRAFSAVPSSQFPWAKLFRESTVAKLADIPVNHISEDVYKTSVDWISKQPLLELQSFVLWGLDSILVDFANQLGSVKGSKKSVQPSSKSQLLPKICQNFFLNTRKILTVFNLGQVAIFVVLAMVLRRKPDALIGILPTLRDTPKYQGQEKLPVIVWMVTQAGHGDLCVGLYAWAHNLLPMVVGKSCNPQSRDLILQLIERILSGPKARTILVSGAVRKGERLLPPLSFDVLMRVTFPASSARVKATERWEAIYPTLKEVALGGSTGSKAMKQVSQQIMALALKAAGESNPVLSNEATSIIVWCLTENPDCFKQWDKIYMDSTAASVAVLKKISQGWKEFSAKQSSADALREAVKSFRLQNEKALASEEDRARQVQVKEAEKYCKMISAKLTRSYGCTKFLGITMIVVGFGVVMSSNIEGLVDWKKISEFDLNKLSEFDWNKFSESFTEKFLKN